MCGSLLRHGRGLVLYTTAVHSYPAAPYPPFLSPAARFFLCTSWKSFCVFTSFGSAACVHLFEQSGNFEISGNLPCSWATFSSCVSMRFCNVKTRCPCGTHVSHELVAFARIGVHENRFGVRPTTGHRLLLPKETSGTAINRDACRSVTRRSDVMNCGLQGVECPDEAPDNDPSALSQLIACTCSNVQSTPITSPLLSLSSFFALVLGTILA